jgi:hypothetical protein
MTVDSYKLGVRREIPITLPAPPGQAMSPASSARHEGVGAGLGN